MAEGDAHVYNNFKEQLLLKMIDLDTDDLKIALYSSAPAYPDGAAPAYAATNEISASGYTAGGMSLSGLTVAQDDTNDRASLDATDPTWTSLATATILAALLYDNTTATKWDLILWEIATNSNGGNYTLQFGANGLLLLN